MKSKKMFKFVLFVCLNLFFINAHSQEEFERSDYERETSNENSGYFNLLQSKMSELEKMHKLAAENGDYEKAEMFEKELMELSGNKIITPVIENNTKVIELENKEESESVTDWLSGSSNPSVQIGTVKGDTLFGKKLEIKQGEDGNLYAMISNHYYTSPQYSSISFYKSTNQGYNWSQIKSIGVVGKSISNISFIIESKNNLIPDSTRLIGFYTFSSYTNHTNSDLNYVTVKVSNGSYQFGTIAYPSSGNTITHVSAVSDGAFYESATYFGVVFTETDNSFQNAVKIRFLRTINWGASWTESTLNTGFNDFCTSADFKEGSLDSVYIAVERRLNTLDRQIRILTTTWIPSSNYRTIYITSASTTLHENPCLTIKQNTFADTMMVTYTRNKSAYYQFSSNGGATWSGVNSLGNSSTVRYVNCSSAGEGNKPFTICWQNLTSDSVNVRKGAAGNLDQTVNKVNATNTNYTVAAASVNVFKNGNNYSGLIYYSLQSPSERVLYCGESLKQLDLTAIPEGFYSSTSNSLNKSDSVKVYLRKSNSPYAIADSAIGLLNNITLTCYFKFYYVNDGNYFIELKHRNSIKVWSSNPVDFSVIGNISYNFTESANSAYGGNQIKVDNSPVRYGIYSGDVSQDGTIDGADGVLIDNDAAVFASGDKVTDLNGDNIIDGSDAVLCDNNSANFVSAITP